MADIRPAIIILFYRRIQQIIIVEIGNKENQSETEQQEANAKQQWNYESSAEKQKPRVSRNQAEVLFPVLK